MSSRAQGRVDQGRREAGGRINNFHVPSKAREGDDTSTSTTPAVVVIALPSPHSLQVGQTMQGTGQTTNSLGVVLDTPVTGWQSSNPSVATVDGTGLVRAVSVGTTVITATYQSITSNPVTVTVASAPFDTVPSSILVNPASVALTIGSTSQLQGIVKNAESAEIPAAVPDAWHSSDPTKATVNSSGLLTGVGVGSTTITATITSPAVTSNSCTVTVSDPVPSAITIAPTSATVHVGATQQILATVTNAESAALPVTPDAWHSSDTSKATVDGTGKVTGVASGSATITATLSSPSLTSNSCTITVDVPVDTTPASIALAPTSATVGAGNTQQLAATVKNAAGSTLNQQPDAWQSSNTAKATVNSSGLVQALAAGSANITATITSPSVTSNTVVITVPSPVVDGEPVFGDDPTDASIVSENFDSYSTVADFIAQQTHSGVHLGDPEGGAHATLITGRSGGKAYRLTYTNQNFNIGGGVQEIHKIETYRDGHAFDEDAQGALDDLTFGKTVIVQDWRRITCPGGFGVFDDIAMKWMEFFQPGGDSNLRQLFYTTNHGSYPSVWPNGAIFGSIGKNETFYASGPNTGLTADGKQDIPHPNIGELAQSGAWFKSTFMFRGHTSTTQKDGFARMWVNGTEIIRIRQDAVNVIPSGAVGDGHGSQRPWCIQADVDNLHLNNAQDAYNRSVPALVWYHQLISFTGNNFDGGAQGFTVDTDDILVWTRD